MEITEKQHNNIAHIAKEYSIRIMVLFGSQNTGNSHAQSDIDIGIMCNIEPQSYHTLLNVQHALREVFFGKQVDVRYLHNVSPLFLFEAVYKGTLIYGSEYDFVKFCSRAFKQFIETKPFRELQETMVQKKQDKLLHAYV